MSLVWAKVYACSAFAQPHFKLFFEKKQEFGLEPFFASSGQIQSGDFSRLPHRLRQACRPMVRGSLTTSRRSGGRTITADNH